MKFERKVVLNKDFFFGVMIIFCMIEMFHHKGRFIHKSNQRHQKTFESKKSLEDFLNYLFSRVDSRREINTHLIYDLLSLCSSHPLRLRRGESRILSLWV